MQRSQDIEKKRKEKKERKKKTKKQVRTHTVMYSTDWANNANGMFITWLQ